MTDVRATIRARPAGHAHRPRGGARRRRAQLLHGPDRARHRGPAAGGRGRPTLGLEPAVDPALEIGRRTSRRRRRLRAAWSCSAATARSCAAAELARGERDARCSASTSGTSASSPRPSATTSESTIEASSTRRYTVEERITLDVSVYRDGELVAQHLGAQRGQRREGRPRADARGGRRGRRPAAVPLGLRRRRLRDADRLDGVRLLRRRPGRLARGRGAADGADQRARAVRPAAGRGADVGAGRRAARPAPRARACCGATAAAPSTCRRAPASRYAAARDPVRLVAAARGAVHRPAGGQVRAARRGLARRRRARAQGRGGEPR